MRALLLLLFSALLSSALAIKCNKGEYGYFSEIECGGQEFCVHVDDNGYTFADCGNSTNPGIRTIVKLVDKGFERGECTRNLVKRDRNFGFSCCNTDYCNGVASKSSLLFFSFASAALIAVFSH